MTNSAGFSLLLTNKCVKPICVSIFVLTFHRILSSSHSQSPGSRKPWFMFSVLINCMVAHCCPSCLASPTSTFRFLPPCLSYSSLSCIFFLSPESMLSTSGFLLFLFFFFFCLCAWGLLSLPHPVSFPFFQIRRRWELVLESYVLLASLYGSCDFFFFFEPLQMVGWSLRLLSQICCQSAALVGPAVPHCMLGLPVRVNWHSYCTRQHWLENGVLCLPLKCLFCMLQSHQWLVLFGK